MKRIILLVLVALLMCGCVNINSSNYEEIIDAAITSDVEAYNTYRNGYKFYLPSSLYVTESKNYNETISGGGNIYYLYIDAISYLNNKENTYEENADSYYSQKFTNGDKSGYVEINLQNDKYLVEIVYNYAKIEVMVDESDLKEAVTKSIIVLSSIYYNDALIKSDSENNVLNYNEEKIDIFKSAGDTSNFLEYVEEYDPQEDDYVPDYDVIN